MEEQSHEQPPRIRHTALSPRHGNRPWYYKACCLAMFMQSAGIEPHQIGEHQTWASRWGTYLEALPHLGHNIIHARRLLWGGGLRRLLAVELDHQLAPLLAHPVHVPRQQLVVGIVLRLRQAPLGRVGAHLQVDEELPLRLCSSRDSQASGCTEHGVTTGCTAREAHSSSQISPDLGIDCAG